MQATHCRPIASQLSTPRVKFNLLLHWVFKMAAPVPPPGGGAGGAGGGGGPPTPLPPPPVPGPVGPAGPAGPPGPLGPPPTRAALLAQLVAAIQAAAAGIPTPGPGGPTPPPPRVKLPPLICKGLPGERPEAHLLRANDWMDTYNILPVNKPVSFKHTLDHLAREWYDSLTFPIAWKICNSSSVDIFLLREDPLNISMINFSFTPGQDDIEAYIRDVKEAAHQLNYNDEAILHLIKATMPSEIYGTLYNQHDLNTVITMVKDIYAKRPEAANAPLASGGATTPFTLIKAPNGTNKRVYFQGHEPLSDRIDKLTDVLFRMDMDGKPNKKPYKPYITSLRRRG